METKEQFHNRILLQNIKSSLIIKSDNDYSMIKHPLRNEYTLYRELMPTAILNKEMLYFINKGHLIAYRDLSLDEMTQDQMVNYFWKLREIFP